MADAPDCSPDGPVNLADDEQQPHPHLSKMPPIVYGTAWKKERTVELVLAAVRAGFRGIDTACQPKHYNEPAVGEAIAQLAQEGVTREQLWIQTKYTPYKGQDPDRLPYKWPAPLEQQERWAAMADLVQRLHLLATRPPMRDPLAAAWRARPPPP